MKRNNSRALARIKRIYKSSTWYINKVKKLSTRAVRSEIKRCESFREFLEGSIHAKRLLHTTVPYRTRMEQIEHHREIKKSRVAAKKQIQEGIQEFEETEFDFNEIC